MLGQNFLLIEKSESFRFGFLFIYKKAFECPPKYFAFLGHGLSLLRKKKAFCRGLRTRAVPVGVSVF
jgi:hypothetical protein